MAGSAQKIIKKSAAPVFFILLSFVWISCGGDTDSTPVTEIVDGVELVHNPQTPLYPERAVSLQEDLTISSESAEGEVVLFLPTRVAVDESEQIYILDHQDCTVKVFDSQGRFQETIGGKGPGPGEFQSVSEIMFFRDGCFIVLDWELRRLSIFGRGNRFVGSHGYQNSCFGLFLTLPDSYIREEMLIEPTAVPMEWKKVQFIKQYDLSGEEIKSYGRFTAEQSGFINDEGERFSYSLPYFPHSVFAGDVRLSRLYHCLNEAYVIEVYNEEGEVFRKMDRAFKPRPTTAEDKRRYLAGFRSSSEKHISLIDKHTDLPRFQTVMERMLTDDEGNLWVETNEIREAGDGRETAYDVFDKDGIYVYRLWLDRNPSVIKGGKMYFLVSEEDTGYRSLKRFRLQWSR
jgi:hypothetical protein